MTYQGHFQNGVVVLDEAAIVPDGVKVRVEILPEGNNAHGTSSDEAGPSLYDRMKDFVGTAEHLPADAATNVDHYLYGHPMK
jgi:hypothetical protein